MQDFALQPRTALSARSNRRRGSKAASAIISPPISPPRPAGNGRAGARLRSVLVNACAARIAVSTFEGAQPFCIAIDGQPREPSIRAQHMRRSRPGARFDFFSTCRPPKARK